MNFVSKCTSKLHLTKNQVKMKIFKTFYALLDILHFRFLRELLKIFYSSLKRWCRKRKIKLKSLIFNNYRWFLLQDHFQNPFLRD